MPICYLGTGQLCAITLEVGMEQVFVVRSRGSEGGRIARTRVYLSRSYAVARARKWRDAGFVVTLESGPVQLSAVVL